MVNRIPTRSAVSMQCFSRQESLGILSVIAMSTAIAGASYARNCYVAKRATIREDCKVIGQAVNSYQQDKGHAPASPGDLVQSGYLVALPEDFKREDCTW
jgi:hypothetical protein